MFAPAAALSLDQVQRQLLESLLRAGSTPQRVARKCQVVLLASEGLSNSAIAQQMGVSRPTVIATRAAFARGGVEAIRQKQKRKRSRRGLKPAFEQKNLDTTLKNKPPHATHLSGRSPGPPLGGSSHLGDGGW